jgi:hypothetical protein
MSGGILLSRDNRLDAGGRIIGLAGSAVKSVLDREGNVTAGGCDFGDDDDIEHAGGVWLCSNAWCLPITGAWPEGEEDDDDVVDEATSGGGTLVGIVFDRVELGLSVFRELNSILIKSFSFCSSLIYSTALRRMLPLFGFDPER